MLLIVIGLIIPVLIVQMIPENLDVLGIGSVPLQRQEIAQKTFFWSYVFILAYLAEYVVNAFLLYVEPSRIFLSGYTVTECNDDHIITLCRKIAAIMSVSTPTILLSTDPAIFTFGLNERRSSILLYERCIDLPEDELQAIFAHELGHVKSDIEENSITHLLSKSHGRYAIVPALVSVAIVASFILDLIIEASGVSTVQDPYTKFIMLVNICAPFALATGALASMIIVKLYVAHYFNMYYTASGVDEFRADLVAFLTLRDKGSLIRSFSSIRDLQIRYIIETRPPSRSLFSVARELYARIMGKGYFAKDYASWLPYFNESLTKLWLTFGRGFDFPKDKLRIQFLNFIDVLVNKEVKFEFGKSRIIRLGTISDIRIGLSMDAIALYAFDDDFHGMPMSSKERVVGYLTGHLDGFNATLCSNSTLVPVYEVIVVIIILLVSKEIIFSGTSHVTSEIRETRDA
jgi:Zn-dependent protease with chaperone function